MSYLLNLLSALITGACLTACGGGADTGSSAPPLITESSPAQDMDDLRNRLIAWYPIGRSTGDLSNRQVRNDLVAMGWSSFVNQRVLPQISGRGLNRVMLHNPFGTLPGYIEPMQFDQYLDAQRAGLGWLTEPFGAAWTPVVVQGIQVIAYIGSPVLDKDSQNIVRRQGEAAFVKTHALPSVQSFLDVGMDIALDAAVQSGVDSATFRFVEKLEGLGAQVFVEAGPLAGASHWFSRSVISRDDTWLAREGDSAFAQRGALSGEIIRLFPISAAWINGHSASAWPADMCSALAQGDSVLVQDALLNAPERTIEGLADCVDAASQ